MQNRKDKGFNTIQIMAMCSNHKHELYNGGKNYLGEWPFINYNPVELNELY